MNISIRFTFYSFTLSQSIIHLINFFVLHPCKKKLCDKYCQRGIIWRFITIWLAFKLISCWVYIVRVVTKRVRVRKKSFVISEDTLSRAFRENIKCTERGMRGKNLLSVCNVAERVFDLFMRTFFLCSLLASYSIFHLFLSAFASLLCHKFSLSLHRCLSFLHAAHDKKVEIS